MQIADLGKCLDDGPKIFIGVHLLQIGLSQATRIFDVRRIRSVSNLPRASPYLLFTDLWYPLIVLREFKTISPMVAISVKVHLNIDNDIGITSSMQRAYLRDAAP